MDYAINPISKARLLLFPIKPMGYLWFLYALFILYIIAYYFERMRIDRKYYVGLFVVLFVLSAFIHIQWLALFRVFRFGLFFAIGNGYAFEVTADYQSKKRTLCIVTIGFIALELFYIYQLYNNGSLLLPFDEEPQNLVIWFILAIGGGYIFINTCKENRQFISEKNRICYLGRNSMVLYLIHQIVISVLRAILIKLHLTSIPLQILLNLCGCVLIGFGIIKLAERFKIIGMVFWSKKYLTVSNNIV